MQGKEKEMQTWKHLRGLCTISEKYEDLILRGLELVQDEIKAEADALAETPAGKSKHVVAAMQAQVELASTALKDFSEALENAKDDGKPYPGTPAFKAMQEAEEAAKAAEAAGTDGSTDGSDGDPEGDKEPEQGTEPPADQPKPRGGSRNRQPASA